MAIYLAPASPAQGQSSADVPTRIEGMLTAMGAGKWMVGAQTVLVSGDTVIVEDKGRAEYGAWVIVFADRDEAGALHARTISVERPADAPRPMRQFTGLLTEESSPFLVIDGVEVRTTETTHFAGNPDVGWLVSVTAEDHGTELVALAVEAIGDDPDASPLQFEGLIEGIGSAFWQVDGQRVTIDQNTGIWGDGAIGEKAEVEATLKDGSLLGSIIRVVDPSTEVLVGAYVSEIARADGGMQEWDVIVFAESAPAEPVTGIVHVADHTFVDESRALARPGQWAEVRGVAQSAAEYQAEAVRLEQPLPVELEGEITIVAPQKESGTGGWAKVGKYTVWLGAQQKADALRMSAGDAVLIRGVRLGNGVIWAHSVEPSTATTR